MAAYVRDVSILHEADACIDAHWAEIVEGSDCRTLSAMAPMTMRWFAARYASPSPTSS